MSRSYKKKPWYTDGNPGTVKESKKAANSIVRQHNDETYNGNSFKKLSCSYDIHDYKSRWTWEEAKEEYENDKKGRWHDKYPTLKDFHRYWLKCYRRK